MDSQAKIREFLQHRLELRGDPSPLGDHDSLFLSGRLDSLDAMQTILFLEEHYAVDFGGLDFSLELIDTPQEIDELVRTP